MKSSKLLGKYVCEPVMALFVFFLLMEGSSAADTSTEKKITKLFLTSGQVDLAREVVRLPLHRGRLSSGETVWFVLTDVSDFATSKKMGLTWARASVRQKTSRARGLQKWMSPITSPSNRGGLISHQFKR